MVIDQILIKRIARWSIPALLAFMFCLVSTILAWSIQSEAGSSHDCTNGSFAAPDEGIEKVPIGSVEESSHRRFSRQEFMDWLQQRDEVDDLSVVANRLNHFRPVHLFGDANQYVASIMSAFRIAGCDEVLLQLVIDNATPIVCTEKYVPEFSYAVEYANELVIPGNASDTKPTPCFISCLKYRGRVLDQSQPLKINSSVWRSVMAVVPSCACVKWHSTPLSNGDQEFGVSSLTFLRRSERYSVRLVLDETLTQVKQGVRENGLQLHAVGNSLEDFEVPSVTAGDDTRSFRVETQSFINATEFQASVLGEEATVLHDAKVSGPDLLGIDKQGKRSYGWRVSNPEDPLSNGAVKMRISLRSGFYKDVLLKTKPAWANLLPAALHFRRESRGDNSIRQIKGFPANLRTCKIEIIPEDESFRKCISVTLKDDPEDASSLVAEFLYDANDLWKEEMHSVVIKFSDERANLQFEHKCFVFITPLVWNLK